LAEDKFGWRKRKAIRRRTILRGLFIKNQLPVSELSFDNV